MVNIIVISLGDGLMLLLDNNNYKKKIKTKKKDYTKKCFIL